MAEETHMDGLRAYIRLLRQAQRVSQEQLADAIGLSRRAFIYWETGQTDDIKLTPIVKAIAYLRAPIAHVQQLVATEATAAEGEQLAQAWLANDQQPVKIERTPEANATDEVRAAIVKMRAELERLERKLDSVVERKNAD